MRWHLRQVVPLCLLLALTFLAPDGAGAQDQNEGGVDVALVLAVDTSASIKPNEWQLEIEGYANAFRTPQVIEAITEGPYGVIAVTVVTWGGWDSQSQEIDWMLVYDTRSAHALASKIERLHHYRLPFTSVVGAITFCDSLMGSIPYKPLRQVIDISGDGKDSNPRAWPQGVLRVSDARDAAVAHGSTINGLPILGPDEPGLADYYKNEVIGGPGSFLVVAEGWDSFAAAIRRKLILEISGLSPDDGVQYASR